MTPKIGRTTFLVAFAMALVSMVPSAYAQHCSVAGASGKYAFSDGGSIINVGPRAAVGLVKFDAAGNVQGSVTASVGGTITQTTLSGTYTVNPDCSGQATFGEFDQSGQPVLTATVSIAWDDNMREARFIFTSVVLSNGAPLSTAINGVARKMGDHED